MSRSMLWVFHESDFWCSYIKLVQHVLLTRTTNIVRATNASCAHSISRLKVEPVRRVVQEESLVERATIHQVQPM